MNNCNEMDKVGLSITTIILFFPFESGNPLMKFVEISTSNFLLDG